MTALPLHFDHHEAFLGSQLDETCGLALGARVVAMSVENHHQRNSAGSCLLDLTGHIFVPQVLVGLLVLASTVEVDDGELDDIALDAELVEHRERNELEILDAFGIVDATRHVERAIEVVVAIVGAEHLVPGISHELGHRSLGVLVDDNLEQGIGHRLGSRSLVGLGSGGSSLATKIGGHRESNLLACCTIDGHDAGDGTRHVAGCKLLVDEGGTTTNADDLDVGGGTSTTEEFAEGLHIGSLPLVGSRIDNHDTACIILGPVDQAEFRDKRLGRLCIELLVGEEIELGTMASTSFNIA